MWADIVFGLAWGWSVITPPYSEKTVVRHAVQAAVFVELVLIKNAIAKAVAWRLRDQGHEFESVFLNWHARAGGFRCRRWAADGSVWELLWPSR